MRRTVIPLFLLTPFLLVACETGEMDESAAASAPASEVAAPIDEAAVEADLSEIREGWVRAAKANDAATVASYYTEDARFVSGEGELAEGRQAIQQALAPGFEALQDLQVTSTDLVVGADMVSDMGRFTQTLQTPEGETQEISGTYVVVLRRQPDGTLKIVHHLSSVPPPTEEM